MKVLSLLQPWATLVVTGHKKIETRSWNTKHKGELLIHASAGKRPAGYKTSLLCEKLGIIIPPFKDLPFGSIIGKVDVVNTGKTDENGNYAFDLISNVILDPAPFDHINWGIEQQLGDFSKGRYGWLMSHPVQFKHPIPAKGKLSIWDFKFEGTEENFILQCQGCGLAASSNKFCVNTPAESETLEDFNPTCPVCESEDLQFIIENLPM